MEFYIQRIAIFVAFAVGVVAAPFLIIEVVSGNYIPLMGLFAFEGLLLLLFGMKGKFWLIIPCSTALGWTLNFLPVNFNMIEIASMLAALYMVVVVMVMERRPFRYGNPCLFVPILILFGLITYHWVASGGGFRILGGTSYGGRRNFQILLGLMPYLIIMTCAYGNLKDLNRVPWLFMLSSIIGAAPFIVSTFLPSTAVYLYYFTGNVNAERYNAAMGNGGADDLSRIGVLGPLAVAIQAWLVSKYPIQTWWHPRHWLVALLSLACLFGAIRSGFRSNLFIFMIMVIVAAFLWMRWKILWFFVLGGVAVFVVVAGQGALFNLPPAAQRSLSFLPGDWDEAVVESAKTSDAFRNSIKEVYWDEYGKVSPLIGNGFAVDPRVTEQSLLVEINQGIARGGAYEEAKSYILRKDFHEGLISIWDSTGAIGLVTFICLAWGFFHFCWKNRERLKPENIQPIHIWCISFFASTSISYFAVFGDFRHLYPAVCAYSAYLMTSLPREESEPVSDRDKTTSELIESLQDDV